MDAAGPAFDVTSYPHRSLGVEGFRVLLIALIAINAFAGIVFVLAGAWPVAGFLGLDVLAVYVAFRLSYAQAAAYERITIAGASVIVERVDPRGRRQEWRFPSYWASVRYDGDETRGTVTLRSHGNTVEVGSYLSHFERQAFADVLREALRVSKTSDLGSQA